MIDREKAIRLANEAGMINFVGANWQCVTDQIQALITRAQNEGYEEAAQIVDHAVDGSFRSCTAKEIRALKHNKGF